MSGSGLAQDGDSEKPGPLPLLKREWYLILPVGPGELQGLLPPRGEQPITSADSFFAAALRLNIAKCL